MLHAKSYNVAAVSPNPHPHPDFLSSRPLLAPLEPPKQNKQASKIQKDGSATEGWELK
jgi:hypothetical protein